MDDLKGRCISCGFLGVAYRGDVYSKVQGANEAQYEIGREARTSGLRIRRVIPDAHTGVRNGCLFCLKRVVPDLDADVERAIQVQIRRQKVSGLPENEEARIALDVLGQDRHCDQWIRHIDGLTPRDHLGVRLVEEVKKLE